MSDPPESKLFDSAELRRVIAAMRERRSALVGAERRDAARADLERLRTFAERATDPVVAARALCLAAEEVQAELHDVHVAAELFEKALGLNPFLERAAQQAEVLLHKLGAQPRRIELLRRRATALASSKSASDAVRAAAFRQAAIVQRDFGDRPLDALPLYERAVALDPEIESLEALSELYAQRGQPGDEEQAADICASIADALQGDEAIDYANRALDLMPDHNESMTLLERLVPVQDHGRVLRKRFVDYITRAGDDDDADPRRICLARVFTEEGKLREAIACLAPAANRGHLEAIALRDELQEELQSGTQRKRGSSTTLVGLPMHYAATQDHAAQAAARPEAGTDEPGAGDETRPAPERATTAPAAPDAPVAAPEDAPVATPETDRAAVAPTHRDSPDTRPAATKPALPGAERTAPVPSQEAAAPAESRGQAVAVNPPAPSDAVAPAEPRPHPQTADAGEPPASEDEGTHVGPPPKPPVMPPAMVIDDGPRPGPTPEAEDPELEVHVEVDPAFEAPEPIAPDRIVPDLAQPAPTSVAARGSPHAAAQPSPAQEPAAPRTADAQPDALEAQADRTGAVRVVRFPHLETAAPSPRLPWPLPRAPGPAYPEHTPSGLPDPNSLAPRGDLKRPARPGRDGDDLDVDLAGGPASPRRLALAGGAFVAAAAAMFLLYDPGAGPRGHGEAAAIAAGNDPPAAGMPASTASHGDRSPATAPPPGHARPRAPLPAVDQGSAKPDNGTGIARGPMVFYKVGSTRFGGAAIDEAAFYAGLSAQEAALTECYTQALKRRPQLNGYLVFVFPLAKQKPRRLLRFPRGSLRDNRLARCAARVITGADLPVPAEGDTQVRLPLYFSP